jgi:NAD(P)-dependent dehydrogenase (short-subunit alcohol dehydrogenase family)
LYFHAECANEEEVQQYVRKTVDLFGGMDVLVHCVGLTGEYHSSNTLTAIHMMDILSIECFNSVFKL